MLIMCLSGCILFIIIFRMYSNCKRDRFQALFQYIILPNLLKLLDFNAQRAAVTDY